MEKSSMPASITQAKMTKVKLESGHHCIVNLGLFRTGTTTLAKAAETLGLRVYRAFHHFNNEAHRDILVNPRERIKKWWLEENGAERFLEMSGQYNLICDGWIALLIFLPGDELKSIPFKALSRNINLTFIATTRDKDLMIASELHHWVRYHLVEGASLTYQENCNLERMLCNRATAHAQALDSFADHLKDTHHHPDGVITMLLPVCEIETSWAQTLAACGEHSETTWSDALQSAGVQNCSPPLPVEGILMTARIGELDSLIRNIGRLLTSIEEDAMCHYLIVIALDHDEADSVNASTLIEYIKSHSKAREVILIVNPPHPDTAFPICQVWHRMAEVAWSRGASWVILLGDDVVLHCPFHYRAIYCAFSKLSKDFDCPLGFGCPWFNDVTFPGFPTFPIIGRVHHTIFHGLIPNHRSEGFVNQDLDPYLQRLYLKFGASPILRDVRLTNEYGGNNGDARYGRVFATGWRDWVLDDVGAIEKYLKSQTPHAVKSKILVDVIIPTYRLSIDVLERICSLQVPQRWRTQFIIIIDNPALLLQKSEKVVNATYPTEMRQALDVASSMLEKHLSEISSTSSTDDGGNNIRVRSNLENLGASASRNRGIDESAAEYILFLDDDIIPEANLLEAYDVYFQQDTSERSSLLGLVGLVQFPRSPSMPMKHASVLMSYLTFTFEIASNPIYQEPAWRVTANLLVKRIPGLRFDTDYAKTGGGEDVDFCLRLGKYGRFKAAPNAVVYHPFWDGSVLNLAKHFFNWALGDSALFSRFPHLVYRSFPNAVEYLLFLLPMATVRPASYAFILALVLACDVAVDVAHWQDFCHRREVLGYPFPLWYCVVAHILANIYVIILETGRLLGHFRRGQLGNLTKRFDWHCGRLPLATEKFRQKEGCKFASFVAVVGMVLHIMR